MATIGTIIDGKYELLKMIGKGGMSKVYLAMDKRLNKQWAVKEIIKNSRSRNNDIIVQSLIAEANLMKKLDHPALPRIVDIIENHNTIYVIMDYIEGETLSLEVERNGAQSEEVVIYWAKQLCEALDYLHTRTPAIIYRDMKPGNVMLRPDGTIKLIDFGIAREYKEDRSEDTVSLGTKGYAAPEQFGGKGQTDPRTDIYCLGVTLYHLVTGKNPSEPPYELYPIRYWNSNLSGGLENIIIKCTQLNPDDRYQSCAELLYDLNHYEEVDDNYKRKQKRKLSIFITVCALCLFFILLGVIGKSVSANINNNNYEDIIVQAEKATSKEEAEKLYIEAINLKPIELSPYLGMIELYKDDASFELEEQAQLMNIITPNLSELRKEENYKELAFEMGKLYWYYYSYGSDNTSDNKSIRMKYSIEWFNDVLKYSSKSYKYYNMSKIYYDIGKFYKEAETKSQEGADKGIYIKFFNDLQEILKQSDMDESDIVNLEIYRLVINSIEHYAQHFKNDDVSKEELLELYEDAKDATEKMNTTTSKTVELKKDVESRYVGALKAVNDAYSGK